MLKLFGIPNCDTVKKARVFLEAHGHQVDFIDLKKTPPLKKELLRWKDARGDWPVNAQSVTYKKHKAEFEALSTEHKLPFLSSHSSMLKRPILERDGRVLAFGFVEEEYKSLLK